MGKKEHTHTQKGLLFTKSLSCWYSTDMKNLYRNKHTLLVVNLTTIQQWMRRTLLNGSCPCKCCEGIGGNRGMAPSFPNIGTLWR